MRRSTSTETPPFGTATMPAECVRRTRLRTRSERACPVLRGVVCLLWTRARVGCVWVCMRACVRARMCVCARVQDAVTTLHDGDGSVPRHPRAVVCCRRFARTCGVTVFLCCCWWCRAAPHRYGANVLSIPSPSFAKLFEEHATAPFFVFQVRSFVRSLARSLVRSFTRSFVRLVGCAWANMWFVLG